MIDHSLKIDTDNFQLLKGGKKLFLIQYDPESVIKIGNVLSYTDISDSRMRPDEFRCLVEHIGTEHVAVGYRALGFVDIDNFSKTSLMGVGALTAKQRENLRRDPWDGIGLLERTKEGYSEAIHWRSKVKEWEQAKKVNEVKRQEKIADFTDGLMNQFINENAAKEFLARG